MQYFKQIDEKLVCLLCQHYCKLKPNQIGICGINQNRGDKIECLTYGYPSAMNIDPVEKKPLYHFLPNSKAFSIGTVGCNFKCPFCQNWQLSQNKTINKSDYFTPKQIVTLALENNCESIAYTYNEPTVFYPYAKDIALIAQKNGIKNIFVSNGYESDEVRSDMLGLIDAINIDIKSFNAQYYKEELFGKLNKILDNAKFFKQNGIWVEITTLVVPTKNDSDEELEQIALFIANELGVDTPWHISAFHPDYKQLELSRTSIESLEKAFKIGQKVGLKYVYVGNVGYEYSTICKNCDEVLIQREYFNAKVVGLENGKCKKCETKLDGVI